MSGLAIERPIVWANGLAPDRDVVAGVFGLRPLRYMSDAAPPAPPVVEGLRIKAIGCTERPVFHQSTGLYGFLRIPGGATRVEIEDPARRYLPWAVTVTVPDRAAIVDILRRGGTPPATPKPLLIDVALRPAPGAPLPPWLTAIWGIVREAGGAPVPLARIGCATVGGDKVVTYAARDGAFLLVLPGEKPSSLASPPVFDFPRALTLHSPHAALAAALTGPSLVAAMPTGLETLDPDIPGGPFQPRTFRLIDSAGAVTPGPNPPLPVRAAQQSRWDIELF